MDEGVNSLEVLALAEQELITCKRELWIAALSQRDLRAELAGLRKLLQEQVDELNDIRRADVIDQL